MYWQPPVEVDSMTVGRSNTRLLVVCSTTKGSWAMSVSVLVHCPSCHAEGNLADPALFGKAISCPVCQQVFVAPMPLEQAIVASVSAAQPEAIDASAASSPVAVVADPAIPPSTQVAAEPVEAPAQSVMQEPTLDVPAVQSSVEVSSAPSVEATEPTPLEAATATATPIDVPPVVQAIETSVPLAVATEAAPAVVAPAAPVLPTAQWPAPTETTPQAAASWPMATQVVPEVADGPTVAMPPIPVTAGDFLLPEREAMDGPLPSFMAPVAGAGPAEAMFAQSLPEPAVRGSIQPPKTPSKTLQMVIIGGVSAILLFATVMFLLGDPMRGRKPKLAKPPSEENPIAEKDSGPTETMEEMLKRINASSNPGNK